ncbi:MAG: hypothetical protein B6244_01055 [Candidatus Cloacimonetes bacterium 4572_55]|nr:MAG: hypothetical protein B6244_01055 [Candidatus Cloacimonetes bacterium 4572_55]
MTKLLQVTLILLSIFFCPLSWAGPDRNATSSDIESQRDEREIRLSAEGVNDGKPLIARPGSIFWIKLDISKTDMIEKYRRIELEMDYDSEILSLTRVSDREAGGKAPDGIKWEGDKIITIDLQKSEIKSLYIAFKTIKKGKTVISVERSAALDSEEKRVNLSSDDEIPVITHIEDSSWSRLKALFNE